MPKSAIAARAAEASARASATAPTVRMTFLNEPWPDVLKKVAVATESTLVMDEIPPGRVNRFDRKQYTRGEAVASLNRDLERLGYRLLEKGDHLVLFSLRDLRTDYRRPAYPTNQPGSIGVTRPGSPPMSAGGRGGPNSTTNSGRGPIRQIGAATSDYDEPTDPPTSPSTAARATGPQLSGAVSRATLPRGVGPARSEANGAAPAGVHPVAAMPAKPVEIKVTLKSRKALDVARTIFEGSKPQAALVDDGPAGLPGFVVRVAGGPTSVASSNNEAPVDYTVGIDSDANELIVSAPDARAKQIERLVHTLDEKPLPKDHAERLAPFAGDSARLAGQLQQTMIRLAQATSDDVEKPVPSGRKAGPNVNATKTNGAKSDRSVKSDDPADDPPEARSNGARNDGRQIGPNEGRQPGPNEGRDAAPPQVASPPVQLNLQGPVTVRDVPGVGLVVTGAKADVDAVLGVIRVLELAGTTATPDIHLLGLQNVNSEALAELLTLVYDAMSEVRAPLIGEQRKSVRFVPVVKPNAILIIAPSREMESVLELAEALDQPVDPEAEVEVFRLQYAVASQVVASIDTFYQDRKPMGARVKSFADPRTNSIVVHARPNDLKEVARIVKKIDVGTSGAVARMRIFPLKNATATELATLINAAVQSVLRPPPTPTALPGQQATGQAAGGSTPTQLSDVKSTILEFLSTDGNQEKLIRSGILADIRVTADAGRNTLIVSAPEASLPLLAALIEQLDQPTPLVAEIKVFTLANSSAVTTVDLLRQLFTGQTQQNQQGGQFGGQFNNLAAQQGGLQLAGAEGAGAGLIPLRFTTDARTNTIIAIGSASALEIVEAILLKIDASDVRERKKTVIKLRNTFAADVATAVNQFLAAQRDLAQLDPNLVSTVELLEREVIVVPELVSNSLILSATPRYFQEAVDLIDKLDRRPKEVVIQALLVEVTLTNNDEYGVELGLQDSILFRRTIPSVANNNLPGFLFNNQQLGNNINTPDPRRVGGQSLTNFSLNRTNNDLGFGGMVLSASSESVSVLIRALSSKRTVHILSRPQIRTLDNQIAQILVGQQVPVATGVATTGLTAASPQVQLRDVGIVLNVIPRISPDGTIVMEVAATSSSVSATRVPIFTDITTGNTVDSPIINVTSAQATISVPNGQTVVLGGMITKQDDAFERKVPWLGDLPYIGNVFRYEGVNARRSELLVFLTPRVVRHEADSELIKRVEAERLHFIERDAEEIHGPLYSAPPPEWYLNRPQPGETPFDPRCLNDRNDVPTTIMPSFPDGSVQPLPNGPTETAPPPTPVPPEPEPGLDRPAGTPRPPEPEPGRLRLDEPAGPPGQAGRAGSAARKR